MSAARRRRRLLAGAGSAAVLALVGVVWLAGGFGPAQTRAQSAPVTVDLGRLRVGVEGPATVTAVGAGTDRVRTRVRVPVTVQLTDRQAGATHSTVGLRLGAVDAGQGMLKRAVRDRDSTRYDTIEDLQPWQSPHHLVWEFVIQGAVERAGTAELVLSHEQRTEWVRYGGSRERWVATDDPSVISVRTVAGPPEEY